MRGSGYAATNYVPPSALPRISVTPRDTGLVLAWQGAGMLQAAANVTGPWNDVAGASSPHEINLGSGPGLHRPRSFYRLRGVAPVHSGVGAGCPQQGFNFTGLPLDHWANHPATDTQCGWIVPELLTGFDNAGGDDPFVRIVLRSFNVSNNWAWWEGNPQTWEDDAIHQNEGWFYFRVRPPPNPSGQPREYRLRFELCFDNPYRFTNGPLQLNRWWADRTWDWEDRNGRHVFTPMYRLISSTGPAGAWQHIAETNVHPVAGHTNDGRHYRCLFDQVIPSMPWTEIQVAQNLPYTLDDRARLLEHAQTNYLPQHRDLCIRKRHLAYGGLFTPPTGAPHPWGEFNELYAIEVFRKAPGSECVPDLPNNRIVVVLAGVDYEPAGNWVAEGCLLEVLDHWSDPTKNYRDRASYVVIPIGNPDAYEWGTCHVVPYGNGYDDNAIHRGYIFLEPESAVPDGALDPEALALRNYIRTLTQQGLDGQGGQIMGLLDFQNDLCPAPSRWNEVPSPPFPMFPPIYGGIGYSDVAQSNAAVRLIEALRDPADCPHTESYVRPPSHAKGWWKYAYAQYDIPFLITFEFDAAALYAETNKAPAWMDGEFTDPIRLPGRPGAAPTFHVHGYIDQIGQATAPDGDPAHVFKLFGQDIMTAVRRELLPTLPGP